MASEIFLILNFFIGIFCFITGFFLIINAFKSQKKILYPFSLYFLVVSLSLFVIFFYASISEITTQLGHDIVFLSIFLTFISAFALLLSTFYINLELPKNLKISEIFISVVLFILILLLFPINVNFNINQEPNISFSFAIFLFFGYLCVYGFCIINLANNHGRFLYYTKHLERNLILFFSLGIILTFSKILSFFSIKINESLINYSFMDVLVLLFVLQIFLVVYSFPLDLSKKFSIQMSKK